MKIKKGKKRRRGRKIKDYYHREEDKEKEV
jgi:hypothetical protein